MHCAAAAVDLDLTVRHHFRLLGIVFICIEQRLQVADKPDPYYIECSTVIF